MESAARGRSSVPTREIARPGWKPPCSTIRSATEDCHAPQAVMISGVGCANPYVKSMNRFMVCSFSLSFRSERESNRWRTCVRRQAPSQLSRLTLSPPRKQDENDRRDEQVEAEIHG